MSARNRRPMMSVEQALGHFQTCRREDEIVISSMASARLWPIVSEHALDFHYNPSTMGGAVPMGVGLALARPEYRVTVLSGEGSLLMSLGSLVTVIGSGVTNLTILLLDNAMFEVTGGQQTAAGGLAVDYGMIARGSGFDSVAKFSTLDEWQSRCEAFFAAEGPRFGWLEVGPTPTRAFDTKLPPVDERLALLKGELR